MFGYIMVSRQGLTEEQVARYQACYCGLCRTLQQRHGWISRLALSYDLTFVILLLGSLYEPEEIAGSQRCLIHPRGGHAYWRTVFSDYAADMNLALAYYKCWDDWQDDGKLPQLASAKFLDAKYKKLRQVYPQQCRAIEDNLAKIRQLERQNCSNPDVIAACFGDLMGRLLAYRDDNWQDILYRLGRALGVFIYMLDACLDLQRDQRKGVYNPLVAAGMTEDLAAYEDMLTMLMADCAEEFEKLPLLKDIAILRNIIYRGVWQKYFGRLARQKDDKKNVEKSVK